MGYALIKSGGMTMTKMRAVDAAVRILEKEGIDCAFGVPGAAINPFYSALKARGSVRHILARHVEGASPYGGRLYPRRAWEYRRLHRHLRTGWDGHDHRSLFCISKFNSDPLHHRAGATCAPRQGRFSGRRHRVDCQARDQMGGDRHGAGARSLCIPEGLSHHAFRASRVRC